jgi:hypothetical protein
MADLPILSIHFERHEEVKDRLLKLISEQQSSPSDDGDRISNTDWYVDVCGQREYWDFLWKYIGPEIDHIYKNVIGYDKWELNNYWFQQYKQNDTHGWHWHHKVFYNNVYYVELPEGSPGTELQVPITGEIIRPNVKEGDILIFPALMLHQSPPNQSEERKTVVAFNVQ